MLKLFMYLMAQNHTYAKIRLNIIAEEWTSVGLPEEAICHILDFLYKYLYLQYARRDNTVVTKDFGLKKQTSTGTYNFYNNKIYCRNTQSIVF